METLGRNDTERGLAQLSEQGRIHEYADPNHRLAAIAADFVRGPVRSFVVSSDRSERKELTNPIRQQLGRGKAPSSTILVEKEGGKLRAESYAPATLIRYKSGSDEMGIAPGSKATARGRVQRNQITVDIGVGD